MLPRFWLVAQVFESKGEKYIMKPNRRLSVAALLLVAIARLATAACKSSGMAVTTRGQLFKINIKAPTDLPDQGEDNLDIILGNRGVNNVKDVLVDVELPPQLIVLNETHGRGIDASHDPGSNVYHYSIGNIQPAEDTTLRYRVRTSFGTMSETGSVKVTAWQRNLPGQKLIENAVIKLRR